MGRNNAGTISETNYFVDSSGTNGLSSGTCSGTCTQKTLAELQALTSTDVTDWSTDDWGFGTTTQLPRVKYAPTATYCTDDTYTTQQTCEDASESWVIEDRGRMICTTNPSSLAVSLGFHSLYNVFKRVLVTHHNAFGLVVRLRESISQRSDEALHESTALGYVLILNALNVCAVKVLRFIVTWRLF